MDVKIEGNPVDQVAVRFNLYHAIIATPQHKPLPIGARGLSCQAYQGAAFWDQEVFNLPMFLYTNPSVAKQILQYRYNTMAGAKEKAKKHGYEGAFYAWISGKTGKELCPDFFFKDVITNRDIRNHFNVWQIHISPDIAVTVNRYVEVTKDTGFLIQYGAEMVFEITRFLASRVDYKPRRNRYEIIRVQGPDEYHENVDNNAFTNYQVKATFDIALDYLSHIEAVHLNPILSKIKLTDEEVTLWKDIQNKLYLPKPNEAKIIEQFDGYLGLESIVPASDVTKRLIDSEEYYGWPNGITVFTQCLKQADTIQLLHLYPELFDSEVVEANYQYYEPRTLHFSSLSPSVYATVAARINNLEDAYRLFRKSLMIDLLNTNEAVSGGTFIGGMHTAANAAAWQMSVLGFAGFHFDQYHFSLNPHLPKTWQSITFNLHLGGKDIQFNITHDTITLTPISKTESVELIIGSQEVVIEDKQVVLKYK
jgi:kojibiose phosphorylase